mmetsp:Transcript_20360/g.59043  ORF Transcript_20360/g.59043 Transcript_20360/m.59043 type:complete len:301 (+) Transcript_20360:197-1099(+)
MHPLDVAHGPLPNLGVTLELGHVPAQSPPSNVGIPVEAPVTLEKQARPLVVKHPPDDLLRKGEVRNAAAVGGIEFREGVGNSLHGFLLRDYALCDLGRLCSMIHCRNSDIQALDPLRKLICSKSIPDQLHPVASLLPGHGRREHALDNWHPVPDGHREHLRHASPHAARQRQLRASPTGRDRAAEAAPADHGLERGLPLHGGRELPHLQGLAPVGVGPVESSMRFALPYPNGLQLCPDAVHLHARILRRQAALRVPVDGQEEQEGLFNHPVLQKLYLHVDVRLPDEPLDGPELKLGLQFA